MKLREKLKSERAWIEICKTSLLKEEERETTVNILKT